MRTRHRVFRQLAALVALILAMSAVAPSVARTAGSQSGAGNQEFTSELGYTVTWSEPWRAADEPDKREPLTLADGEAALTIRGEAAGPAPADRLQQEIDQIIYLNGTAATVTVESDTVATAEWRSDALNRLVSVIAAPDADALVIVTLVAPADAFDDAIDSAGSNVSLDGDPLLAAPGGEEERPADEPVVQPGDDNGTPPAATEVSRETPESTGERTGTPVATEEQERPEETETPDLKLPTQEPLGNGVEGNTYTSPNFGYSFEWDDADWEVAPDGEVSLDNYDLLTLYGDYGILNIYALEDYDGEADACLDGEADFLGSDPAISDLQAAEDADGDPIAGGTATSAYGVYTLTYRDPESERAPSQSFAAYLECRELGDGAVLVILAIGPKSLYNDNIDQVIEVTDTIQLYDEQAAQEEATPAEDDAARDRAGDNDTGSQQEENQGSDRPGDTDNASPNEESEATPSPADRDAGDDTGDTGIEGSVFTSPEFGFSLDIPATWTVEDQELNPGDETLVLNNGTSTVTLWATTSFDGATLTDCVDFAADAADRDLQVQVRVDGTPFSGSDDLSAYAAYTYTVDDTEYTYFIKCQWIEEGDSVLIIAQDVPSEEYAHERRARRQIENLIEMP